MLAGRSSPLRGARSVDTALRDDFPWVSSRTLRFTARGEFPLAFPPECPVLVHFLQFSGDHRLTPSYHDYLELSLVCAGKGRFTVENRRYPVAPGDVLLVGCREFHLLEANGGGVLRAVSVHFAPEFVYPPGGPGLDFEYLKPFHYRSASFAHRIARADLPEDLVLDRVRLIHHELEAGSQDRALAVKTCLRVDLAMKFLSNSAMSVTEIAYASGFSSHSYFDRVFKRLKRVTPLEYRRQLKV